jgi:hypothetical protein
MKGKRKMATTTLSEGGAVQESPINKAISILDRRVTEQSEVVGELIQRLATVLLPDTPKEASGAKGPDEPARSDIEQTLVAYSTRLNYTIGEVRRALEQLTL